MDLAALGDVVTAGLWSKVFSRPTGHAGETHPLCADCGTQTVGRFCHECGNAAHVHRSLLHLFEEFLHGVMHFDGRVWRTLPLLFFRPGRLTREWCHGKRARYVSPLAMFLFTVFVMFLAISYMPGTPKISTSASKMTFAEAQAEAKRDLAKEQARLAKREAALAAAETPQEKRGALEAVEEQRKDVASAQEDVDALARLASLGLTTGDWRRSLKGGDGDGKANWNFNTGDSKLDEKLKHKLENPELALYKLQQTFYKFSFLLVPISIPFVAALFLWKRGFTLYDHGVFVLYSLTFVSILVMIGLGLFRIGGWVTPLVFTLLPLTFPVHLFFQLKGAYDLRTFSALWRTVMLLIFCNVTIALFFVAVIYLGFA